MTTKSLLLACTALITTLTTYGQGTVNFVNLNAGTGLNAPVFLPDGVTKAAAPDYTAELMAGPSVSTLASVATTGFLPTAPGYFSGGTVSIPTVPGGGTAFLQVRVWSTAAGSYAAAQASSSYFWGQSSIFSVTTGDPNASPPGVPASLTGLSSAGVMLVPEPSTVALASLGLSAFFLLRRRP